MMKTETLCALLICAYCRRAKIAEAALPCACPECGEELRRVTTEPEMKPEECSREAEVWLRYNPFPLAA